MAVSTLSNISVPINDANETLLMPKLQYRFRVQLNRFGLSGSTTSDITKQVVDVTRPNLTFEQITIDSYNSRSYLAGKHTWEPVTLNIREDAENKVQKLVAEQLQKQYDFYNQSSASSGSDYKFGMIIEILDGGNGANTANVLETFELVGAYIESANYNSLNYATNDPVTIALSIRYDNAIQYGTGTPDGQPTAENPGIGIATGERSTGATVTGVGGGN